MAMAWQMYKVILQLCSPLHIGCGKIGNLQRTYPYVTGRVMWGALTMRLTRDKCKGNEINDSSIYQEVGEQVHRELAFTYFYPVLSSGNHYQIEWPWKDQRAFRYRFLSSYAGTALDYPQQSAARGMLRETEFISPYTLDEGKRVFLQGYIFEKKGCTLSWQEAVKRLQLGGERGYGWGKVKPVAINPCREDDKLFGKEIKFLKSDERPRVCLPAKARLLAHTVAADYPFADGPIEPLAGREWRPNQKGNAYVGQHIAFNEICFAPGSVLVNNDNHYDFRIDPFGVWRLSEK